MERASIEDEEPDRLGAGTVRHRLSEFLGTTDVAINRYRVAPGEALPGGLHAHADQEEVFVVLEGEATFETLDGEVHVGEREAIRFAPGEFQSGRNGGDEELELLALGAPRETEDVRIPLACPACGRDDLRLDFGGDELTLVCPDCGAEHVPRPCPECGSDDVRVTLGDGTETVVECHECGAGLDGSPFES